MVKSNCDIFDARKCSVNFAGIRCSGIWGLRDSSLEIRGGFKNAIVRAQIREVTSLVCIFDAERPD